MSAAFYLASKTLGFLAAPSTAMLLLALVGVVLIRRAPRLGRALALTSLVALALSGLSPLPAWCGAPLEDRFPAPPDPGAVAGVVVLGGGVDVPRSAARGQLVLNDAGERVVALADLARRLPDARVAYVGVDEAEVLRAHVGTLGLAAGRLIYEEASRNTRENAAFAAALLRPRPGERWLLVTSAWHMPRAVGCFRAAGFAVVPYPVDYRTGTGAGRMPGSAAQGLADLDRVAREWLGLAAYRLAGYTDALFPAP